MTETAKKTALALPDPARPPLKVNVFDAATKANTALMPLFPYLDAGCIVPTVNCFRAGPGREFSSFEHANTVDEVLICFAAQGSRIRPGQVATDARRHRVGHFFADPNDSTSFALTTVTQRQAENGTAQHEAMVFTCSQCQHELVSRAFDAIPAVQPDEMPPGFELYVETIVEAANGADLLNSDPKRRKCPKCGHENEPFPVERWGWRNYRERLALARDAWKQFTGSVAG